MNNEPLIDPKYEEPNLTPSVEANRIEQLSGNFPQVTTTPTWTPKTFRDGIALDTTTGKLYYYDFTNNVWKSASAGTTIAYAGIVAASAVSSTLPTGWSVAWTGASNSFKVTHNLNTTSYVAVPVGVGTVNPLVSQVTQTSNDFTVQFASTGAVLGDTAWRFSLIIIS